LGLAYFWSGSQNAIELQIWGTWLLYAVLIDLTDQTAEALHLPFADISIEMVYRSLYYYSQAHQRGEATDILSYYVAHAKPLGLVKRKRKPDGSAILDEILALTSKPTLVVLAYGLERLPTWQGFVLPRGDKAFSIFARNSRCLDIGIGVRCPAVRLALKQVRKWFF